MRHFFLLFCGLLIAASGITQSDFKVTDARKVKNGYVPHPMDYKSTELVWGGVESSCTDGKVMYGNWFDLSVKSDQVQFTVHTGGKWGNLKKPYVYLGAVSERKGQTSLEEVVCLKAKEDFGTFPLQAKGLSKDVQYYVLVGGEAKGMFYGISVTEKFDYVPSTVESVKSELVTIMGRVKEEDGKSKVGVEVSLLDDQNKVIKSTTTNAQGLFRFEKLPPDEVYLTRIEENDPSLEVSIFLYDSEGHITESASEIGQGIYAFGEQSDAFNELTLLKEKDWTINVQRDKSGIVGRVVDAETHLYGISGVDVALFAAGKDVGNHTTTDQNGSFKFRDLERTDYDVKVDHKKDEHFTEIVLVDDLNVPYEYSNSTMEDDDGVFKFERLPLEVVELKRLEVEDTQMDVGIDFSKMEEGTPIVLNNILFESGSSLLLSSSNRELDELAKGLKDRPDVRIEISGHTDNTGTSNTNHILSENRAKAVHDYLISHGIERSRLSYAGYGETRPVAPNDTEEGKRSNRRVEFVMK